jgi:hypothetical protein
MSMWRNDGKMSKGLAGGEMTILTKHTFIYNACANIYMQMKLLQ